MAAQLLAGVSVLLVDDDADNREVFETYLVYVGATVRTAATADQALESFKASPPSIVVADISLPNHNGIWLLEQIRALPGGPRVPVVALTGRALASEIATIRAAGFDTYLRKPADLDDVGIVIAALTARR